MRRHGPQAQRAGQLPKYLQPPGKVRRRPPCGDAGAQAAAPQLRLEFMYSRAFPDFAGTRAHPAPGTPVGAHRAPTRVEPESALSQAHVSRTPSEALSLASIRREPAATVPVAQMRRQLESLAQDHDPGPGSLARIRRPRCRSSLLPRPPRAPRRLPRDPSPSAPPRPQPRRRLLRVGFGPRGAPAGAGHSPSVRSGAGPGGARSGSARVLETALRRYIAPRLAALQPLLPRALRGASSRESPAPRRGVGRSPAPPRRPWG